MIEEKDLKALRILPREKAFYFFTSIGNYTGQSASSLEEFMEKIKLVSESSLEFHIQRGDFEKWAAEVLEDRELAEKIRSLQKMGLSSDALRIRLAQIVARHREDLKNREARKRF